MENTLNPLPTFHRKPENNTSYSMHDHETKTHRKRMRTKENKAVVHHHHHHLVQSSSDDEEEEEEAEEDDDENKADELEKKIVALQRIVPGGESLGVDKLFEQTAGYILTLQCQIKAMGVLANLIEGLEKEKMKFGG